MVSLGGREVHWATEQVTADTAPKKRNGKSKKRDDKEITLGEDKRDVIHSTVLQTLDAL